MSHGWANKYIWLHSIKLPKETNFSSFEEMIKKGENRFRIGSGTTGGDIVGNGTVLNIYSGRLMDLIEKHRVKIKTWPIRIIFDEKTKKKVKQPLPDYFYIEAKYFIEFINDDSSFKKQKRVKNQEILGSWEKNKATIYFSGNELNKTFYNLSNLKKLDFFGLKSGNEIAQRIIVTEKLKKTIEKAKLKNIEFEELKRYRHGGEND